METAVSPMQSEDVPTRDAQMVAKSALPTDTPIPPATPTTLPTVTPTSALSNAEVSVIEPTPQPTRPYLPFKTQRILNLCKWLNKRVVPLVVVDGSNAGVWQYPENTFIHPIAFEVHENIGYLIDAGRVLALDLAQPMQAETLLQGGDVVEGCYRD